VNSGHSIETSYGRSGSGFGIASSVREGFVVTVAVLPLAPHARYTGVAMSRSIRIAVQLVVVVCAAAAGWALRGGEREETATPGTDGDGSLAECRRDLSHKDAELEAARRTFGRRIQKAPAAPAEPAQEAPERPRGFDGTEWIEPPDPIAEANRERDVRVRVGESLSRELGVTVEEQASLEPIVCPMRASMRGLFAEYARGRLDDEALWRSVREERATMQEGLERTLGRDRTARLVALGGLPLYAQMMCQRR
jgi:hypothetical protein